jgi:hypothetical protein
MEKALTTTIKNMAFLGILFYGGAVCKSSAHRRSKALKSIHTYIEWNHGAKLS